MEEPQNTSDLWQIKHPSLTAVVANVKCLVSNSLSIYIVIIFRMLYYFSLKWEGDAFPYFVLEAKKTK